MKSYVGHTNNIHCLAQAVNGIAGALFTICGHGDIEDRLKEFLAVRQFFKLCGCHLMCIHNVKESPVFLNCVKIVSVESYTMLNQLRYS